MTSPFIEQYTGLYATPELVGRQKILEQFEDILSDSSPDPKLIFLSGLGGTGKTRLLKKVLNVAESLPNCRTTEVVLDFYHVMLHTPIGLANEIFEALTPPFDCFQSYQPAYQALNRARLSGNVVELEKLREDALDKFDQDMRQLGVSTRVVLVLDTIERVVYGLPGWTDEIPFADSWMWLIERLPAWRNVVVFVAGRDGARPAVERLKARNSILVDEIEVGLFGLQASLEYFEKVAKSARENGDYHLAERLENLPQDFKHGAHVYSQGRPIVLSLLVDYLSFPSASELPEMLRHAPPEILGEEDYRGFEEILFERLRESEIGETLITLGRVPKGADEELLAGMITDKNGQPISREEARKRLLNVKRLSVVKIRPNDQRMFLHDEMYAFLQRYVYDSPYDIDLQKNAFEVIKTYYTLQRDACMKRLADLYAPVELHGRERLDLEQIAETHAERQTILAEMMFYILRQDFGRGFRHYYRYSQEAIYSHDILMDMHLQAEILDFLVHHPDRQMKMRIEGELSPKMLLAILQLRPMVRNWSESRYQEVFEDANQILDKVETDWKEAFPVVLAALHIWVAYARIRRGMGDDLSKADAHLDTAFALFPKMVVDVQQNVEEIVERLGEKYSPTEIWYMKAILALAFRVRGYSQRMRGYPQQAIENYRNSIKLLRQLDLRVEMATALNDMSFALANRGKWQDGRALGLDALRLRRELGHRLPVALSLNTLAMIDVYEGQYDSGQNNAERALAIFRARFDDRGKGLALTALAESRRRYAVTTPLLDAEERINLLRQARDHAIEAIALFSASIEEPSRKVEALIEAGCACRDWIKLRREYPNPKDDLRRLIAESEYHLHEACEIARKENIRYREIDAYINLTWLRYYLLEEDLVDNEHPLSYAILKAKSAIPPEYLFDFEGKLNIDPANAQVEIWPQIGKLYILEGHLAHYQLEQIPKEERKEFVRAQKKDDPICKLLESLADSYANSLRYSSLYSNDYRGIRTGKDGIYTHLKNLNEVEMRIVCSRIRALYPEKSAIEEFLRDRTLWQE